MVMGLLPPLPADAPEVCGVAYLSRKWKVDYRTISRWVGYGWIPCKRVAGRPRFARADAETFARQAINVRLLSRGMVARCPAWNGGQPVRIVEARLVGAMWHIRWQDVNAHGHAVDAEPCRGDRIVLCLSTPFRPLIPRDPANPAEAEMTDADNLEYDRERDT
ncbi:hypothetical protein ABT294_00850 [Nonomuraea sp. NPDC000554]|uniref:hypothetical protein n=1 Tax=Nonomuraea sp. NPDC000554 TaxID=3154259 RepID=UPI0033216E9E